MICISLCLLFLPDGLLFGQPVQATAQTAKRVRLIFDEQSMTDTARAEVYDLIARSVPESNWPTLQINQVTDIRALLNTYFDISSTGQGAAPRTQAMLNDLIASANADRLTDKQGFMVAAGPVKVPPVPVRAYTFYNKAEVAARRFDPESMSYELHSPTGEVERFSQEIAPAESKEAERRGRLTEVLITLNDAVKSRVHDDGAAFQRVVAVDDDKEGAATVQLLSDQPPMGCNSATRWLAESPYLASMRNTLTADEIARIKAAAANVPFVIVDWNVDTPTRHGAKVRAVVRELSPVLRPQGEAYRWPDSRNWSRCRSEPATLPRTC